MFEIIVKFGIINYGFRGNMKDNSKFIYNTLKEIIKEPKSELNFNNEFELIIAVLLSAQCTDKRVNSITPKLFEKYATCYELAKADIVDVENIIKPCGFYHNKAKNIINLSKKLVDNFGGKVPNTMEELITLDGVGRKTANVVLAIAFDTPAIAVDTHVHRVSNRLGLSNSNDVYKIEQDLMKTFERKDWGEIHHLILLFGRYYCKSQNPKCEDCKFKEICTYKNRRE